MAKDLLIRLEARDNASAVFQRTGRAGREMGEEIDRGAQQAADALDDMERSQEDVGQSAVDMVLDVGKASDELGRDLPQAVDRAEAALDGLDRTQDQVGQSATEMGRDVDTAGRSLKDFEDAGRTVGAGLALLGTSFSMYASQLVDYERNVAALGRTYGDAAGQFVALANEIQNTTIFSNDEAVQAANIMGTLQRNYGLTNEQIQQLIMTSADLAAINGTTLTDAAQRVAAAIRGEAESAETLGLTMNQAAIDADNLTLTMNNAEAGQFRFNALIEQSTFALGAASDATETAAGKTQQFANRLQDAITGFVEMTGPVGQAAGVISSFGVEAGLALSGAVALAKGLRDLRAASQGVGALATTFGLLTNPITLVGVTVAGMTALAIKNIAAHDDAAKELGTTYDTVAESIRNLPIAELQQGQIQGLINDVKGLDAVTQAMFDRIAAGGPVQDPASVANLIGVTDELTYSSQQLYDTIAAGTLSIEQEQQAISLITQALSAEGANINALIPSINQAIDLHRLWLNTNGELGISGDALIIMLQNMATNADTWGESVERVTDQLVTFSDQITVAESALEALITTGNRDITLIDQLIALQPEIDRVIASITTFTQGGDLFWGLSSGSEGLTQLQADLTSVLSQTGVVGAYAQEAVQNLNDAHAAGIISADQYAAAIHYLAATELPAMSNEATISAYQIGQLVGDMDSGVAAAQDLAEALGLAAVANRDFSKDLALVTSALGESTEVGTRNGESARYQADALYELDRAMDAVLDGLPGWVAAQVALNDALAEQIGYMDQLPQHLNEVAVSVERVDRAVGIAAESVERGQDLWTAYNEAASAVVETMGSVALGILDAATASGILGDTSNTILGQTNSWGSLAQGVADWAGSLAHGRLAQTALDNAVLDGIISRTTYQDALEANHRIQVANAAIQEDILRIQIKQMPIMAQAIEQQAAYVDEVADMAPAAQLAALGFMDQAQSAKALEVAQLAAASATEGQREATTNMIQEMVNADPVLAAMLEKMGLISITDGVVTVNFDDVNSADSALADLTATLDKLTGVLAQIFNIDTETDAPATQQAVADLIGTIDGVPKNVTTFFNAVDNVSLTADAVARAIDAVPTSKTIYLNTVQTGGGVQLNNPFATGGTIPVGAQRVLDGVPAFAGGGTLALVGEAGPELVRLPTGAQVTSNPATRTQLATMTRRGPEGAVIINGPVTLQPAGSDAYSAIRRAALARARGY